MKGTPLLDGSITSSQGTPPYHWTPLILGNKPKSSPFEFFFSFWSLFSSPKMHRISTCHPTPTHTPYSPGYHRARTIWRRPLWGKERKDAQFVTILLSEQFGSCLFYILAFTQVSFERAWRQEKKNFLNKLINYPKDQQQLKKKFFQSGKFSQA